MEILESFTLSKTGRPETNEDVLSMTPDFAAVFDGATDKSGTRYKGMTGGRFAAVTLAEAMLSVPPDSDIDTCVDALSEMLAAAVLEAGHSVTETLGPTASIVIYSAARDEIWRVGDCCYRDGETVSAPVTPIDTVASRARAALLRALVETGSDPVALATDDPGRAMILPLLMVQGAFQNDGWSEFGRGALDGKRVPGRFRERVRPVSREIILASDGYPELLGTLAESEEALAAALAADPLRIYARHPGTKAVAAGARSFDDRSYIRLRR